MEMSEFPGEWSSRSIDGFMVRRLDRGFDCRLLVGFLIVGVIISWVYGFRARNREYSRGV